MPPRFAHLTLQSLAPRETILSAWGHNLAAAPDAPALIGADGQVWTRKALDEQAGRCRQSLSPEAARQRVAFALPNGPEWIATFLALLEIKAVPMPLDASEPPETRRALARAAQAAFLLLDGAFEPVSELRLRAPQFTPKGRGSPLPALIKLTSGSTGVPRALPFSHANMLADGHQVCAGMDIRPTDTNLAVIPFGHSYGLGNLVMPLLIQGTALACADTPLPHALAATIARHQPTIFPLVPALLRALTESDLPADALAPLRTVISAGAPLSAELARAFHARFGLAPHGFYGSSETGGISYDRDGEATLAGRSVGTPLPGVSITPIRGKRVRVSSPAVFLRAGFSPADRIEIAADGELRLLGRAGRLHKIAGRRLDLGELENTLRALPRVADAFVAPHPDDPEQLAAVLATPLAPLPLRTLLREHLAPWKIPRRLVPVAAFPLTARGKPDPVALRALLSR